MSNISTNIGRISSRLDGSRDGCMFVCEFDVFHNVIHSNQVEHSAKHRGIDHNFSVYANFGLRNKLSNVRTVILAKKNYRKFHGKPVPISFES